MNKFLKLVLAFFFCSVLTNGQNAGDCVIKYMVYNLFADLDKMNVTCYSTSCCSLLYFPEGETETNKSVDLGTVPAGETKLIEADVDQFGRLYSNGQIGVSIFDPDQGKLLVLPRGSDAGTNFNSLVSFLDNAIDFLMLCTFAAINEPANVTFQFGSQSPAEMILSPYVTQTTAISFQNGENETIRTTSNASIIATCYDVRNNNYHILQPSLSESVFTFAEDHYATISLSDCETNEPISDFSRVKVEYAGVDDDSCTPYSTMSSTANNSVLGKNCGLLVTPNDNKTCVSITKQHVTGTLAGTGYPESKRVLQVKQMPIFSSSLYSLSYAADNCKLSSKSSPVAPTSQQVLSGSLQTGVFLDIFGGNQLHELGDISCVEPAFTYRSDEGLYNLQSYGQQSQDAWKSYFATINCSISGTRLEIFFSASTWVAIVCIWLCFTSA